MIENRNNDTKVSRLEQSPESAPQSNNPDILSASDVLPSNMRNQAASLQTNITSTDIISEKRVIEEQLQKPIARIKWPEPRHLNTSTSSDPYSLESWRLGKDIFKGIFKPDRFEASVLFNTGLTESEFNDYQTLRPLIHDSVAEIPMTLTNFDNLVVNSVMTFCSATQGAGVNKAAKEAIITTLSKIKTPLIPDVIEPVCDVGQCGEHALELLNNSLDFLENHSTRVIQGLCLELISREGVQIKKHQPNESFVSFIKSTLTPPAKPIADLKAPFVAIKEIAMLPFQQTPTKAELPANSYQTKLKNSGGAQSKAVMNEEQTVDNLDFFEECKLTFKTLFNPTRRTANKLFQRTLTDGQFKLVYWIADYARHPEITDKNRELYFSKFRNLMEETAKHTPMTREIVTAVCRVAARVFEMRGFYGITAVTESIKEIGKHTAITPKIVKAIYSRAANYVPDIRTTELWPGGSVGPLTEALNKIGTKTAITPEIVEAVCNVAGSARKYEPGTLSALTEALKSIKEPVTPALINDFGRAVRSVTDSAGGVVNPHYGDAAARYRAARVIENAHFTLRALTAAMKAIGKQTAINQEIVKAVCNVAAASAGEQGRHTLPALTAALTSIKEPVTPALITKLGAAVCRVAARDRFHAPFTLRALTAALTAINEPVTPALITELGVDICNVPIICRYEGAYALIRLTETLQEIGTKTAITPEIVKAFCSVVEKDDWPGSRLRNLRAEINQLGTKEVLTPELILTILDREGAPGLQEYPREWAPGLQEYPREWAPGLREYP